MLKKDLIDYIASMPESAYKTKRDIESDVDAVLKGIAHGLKTDMRFQVKGFGVVAAKKVHLNERTRYDVIHKRRYIQPAMDTVKFSFKPDKVLVEDVKVLALASDA